MKIIDGHAGRPHINGRQIADANMGVIGHGDYVLSVGEMFRAEVVNDNVIKIYDGVCIMQGVRGISLNGTEELIGIENGVPGSPRNDLIVIRYELKEDSTETMSIVVVQGVGGGGDPQINSDTDIREGDAIHDFPLYRVRMEGPTLTRIDRLFTAVTDLQNHSGARPHELGDDGLHGFRLRGTALQYYNGLVWEDVAGGAGATAYPTFQALIDNLSNESLNAALGEGNEEDIRALGYQLVMYVRAKEKQIDEFSTFK